MSTNHPVHIPYDAWAEIASHDSTGVIPVTCSALAPIGNHAPRVVSVRNKSGEILTYYDGVVRIGRTRGHHIESNHMHFEWTDLQSMISRGLRFPHARKLHIDVWDAAYMSAEAMVPDAIVPDAIASIVDLHALTSLRIHGPWELWEGLVTRINPDLCALESLVLRCNNSPLIYTPPPRLLSRLKKLVIDSCICVDRTTLNPNIRVLCASRISASKTNTEADCRLLGESDNHVVSTLETILAWYPSIQEIYMGAEIAHQHPRWHRSTPPYARNVELAMARGGFSMPVWIHMAAMQSGMYTRRKMRLLLRGGPDRVRQLVELLSANTMRIHPRAILDSVIRLAMLFPAECAHHICASVITSPDVPKECAPTGVYAWTICRARALMELVLAWIKSGTSDEDKRMPKMLTAQLILTCTRDPRTGYPFALYFANRIAMHAAITLIPYGTQHPRWSKDVELVPMWVEWLQMLPQTAIGREASCAKLPRVLTRLDDINCGDLSRTKNSLQFARACLSDIATSAREKQDAWEMRVQETDDPYPRASQLACTCI